MTAQHVGYALVTIPDGVPLKKYFETDPNRQVAVPDPDGGEYTWQAKTFDDGLRRVVQMWRDDAIPPDTKRTGEAEAFDGTRLNIVATHTPLTQAEIAAREKQKAIRDLGDTDIPLIRAIEDLVDRTDKIVAAMAASVAVDASGVPDIPQEIRDRIALRKSLRAKAR